MNTEYYGVKLTKIPLKTNLGQEHSGAAYSENKITAQLTAQQ